MYIFTNQFLNVCQKRVVAIRKINASYMCDECGTLMMTKTEFLRHGKIYDKHRVGWHWNNNSKFS